MRTAPAARGAPTWRRRRSRSGSSPRCPTCRRRRALRALWASSLARGDRVIAPSSFVATAVMERYRLPRERITVIPRGIDTAHVRSGRRRCGPHLGAVYGLEDSGRCANRAGARPRRAVERADAAARRRAQLARQRHAQRRVRHCRRAPQPRKVRALDPRAGEGARRAEDVPRDRPLPRHAGGARGRRRGRGAGDRSTHSRPRGGGGAGHGPAGRDDRRRASCRSIS